MYRMLSSVAYDLVVVASIATLHHLPLEQGLARAASLVRPGGVLLVLDLFQPAGSTWFSDNSISWLWSRWLERAKRKSPELLQAWEDHGRHDRYPTMGEVRRTALRVTPGAALRKHLLWRWTLVWHRPAGTWIAVEVSQLNRKS